MKKEKGLILGAITGDVIGSVFEWNNIKTTDFDLFSKQTDYTDDSVLTIATMDRLLHGVDYAKVYQDYGRRYPGRGYGGNFQYWIHQLNPQPYNSWGNGSAMRVSPVGWAYSTLEEVLQEAEKSAMVTHNHPEGIKGAQAVASAVFLGIKGHSKAEIKKFIEERFAYDLERHLEEIRKTYVFDVSCQGSVPEAIIAFLESKDFEDSIRLAISIGGDSDTIACITGGIAEAFYREIPQFITDYIIRVIPAEMIDLVKKFSDKYGYQA
jgi:ADP-ribosylglycohydrolase